MIVFDLRCAPAGHVFEAWFGSTQDYEAQQARGLVTCPICDSPDVAKAVMAPNIAPKGNRAIADAAATPVATAEPDSPGPAAIKEMLRALARAQARALEHSDYVGKRFADEARAIHTGESEARAIHGVATPAQARALAEDGIDVAALPFPLRTPGEEN